MKRWMLIFVGTALLASCSGGDETKLGNNGSTLTKPQARSMGGVSSEGEDLCDQFDWYGDGICDDFCPEADSDCAATNNTNGSTNSSTNNGTTTTTNNGTTTTNNGTTTTNNGTTTTNNGGSDCGGIAGLTCAAGEWCDYPDDSICGAADQLGQCEPRPEACPDVVQPVCGCDGNDYGNACEANAAGVDVAADGKCTTTCSANTDCAMGEVCVNGVCEADPNGADCGGFIGLTCATGYFCDYAIAQMCGAGDQSGTCKPIPQACPDVYQPVCGCDLKTYGNSCDANAAGVAVSADGACVKTCQASSDCAVGESCINGVCETPGHCGGIAGLVCAADEWCDYPDTSTCGAADQLGDCKTRPQACIQVFDPVCGCDNMTYSNSCMANAAGVDVMAQGACP